MLPCPGCSRFVRAEASRCPFCGTTLRDGPSPVAAGFAGVLLGLTLAACGGDSTGEDGASASASAGASTTMSGATTNPNTSGPGMTSSNEGTTTGLPPGEASVAAYGGPDVDTTPDDETADDGTSTTDDTTSTGSGSGSGSGTGGSTTQ